MRSIKRSICLSLLVLLAGGWDEGLAQQRSEDQFESELVQAGNAFGFKLLRQVHGQAGGENIFISPFSVAMALGMTYNGAAGSTEVAMRETLELGESTPEEISVAYHDLVDRLLGLDPAVEFLPANSIWIREGLDVESDFLQVNRRYFDAEVSAIDFNSPEAAPTINRWVKEKTKGLIEDIVEPPIDPLMMLYLINAIYFKGQWVTPFHPELTAERTFMLADGSMKQVPMMAYASPEPVAHYQGAGVEALDLGYGDSLFSMTIVMPENPGAIDELVQSLTLDRWQAIVGGLEVREFEVYMPKYKLEYELEMKDVLTAMGMGVAFDPAAADFSKIRSAEPRLYIGEVKHKTYVDVNEEGTEAAAVTGVGIVAASLPPRITVNRPFVFAIRERSTGVVLFLGVVMDPTGGSSSTLP